MLPQMRSLAVGSINPRLHGGVILSPRLACGTHAVMRWDIIIQHMRRFHLRCVWLQTIIWPAGLGSQACRHTHGSSSFNISSLRRLNVLGYAEHGVDVQVIVEHIP